MTNTIKCDSLEAMAVMILELTKCGVVFKAYTINLTIELKGGY